ncbi:uncharacterized protein LOC144164008 [Haemaphysalis longicornis]
MATHAYVRYQDDQRKAIVPVRDIKGFRNSDDFSSKVYLVKWTDDSGTSDFYRARVLLVGDSEDDLNKKIVGGRVRVKRLRDDTDDESETDGACEVPKAKKPAPRADLLKILERKKNSLASQGRMPTNKKSDKMGKLKDKLAEQEGELRELRSINRRLQLKLLSCSCSGAKMTAGSSQLEPGKTSLQPAWPPCLHQQPA